MPRVCVGLCADGLDADSPMDGRFGRADRFIVLDSSSGVVLDSFVNGAALDAHGAGLAAASLMGRHAVDLVVAGHFGPKASRALELMGIRACVVPTGLTARQALDQLGMDCMGQTGPADR
jgi:predicted Fe-Mo cluster-binding NifX family protein